MNRKEKAPADANAETKRKKKPPYISFGKPESEALWQLDPRSMWLYFRLKWLSNFKTGEVGTFKDQILTVEGIARMVAIPVRQGVDSNENFIDGTEIRRLLNRLRLAGLVVPGDPNENRFTTNLPMSPITAKSEVVVPTPTPKPISKKGAQKVENVLPQPLEEWEELYMKELEDAAKAAAKSATSGKKLPTAADTESPENPHEDWGSDDSAPSLSVLTNSNTNHYFSVIETGEALAPPNTGGACDTHAPPPHPEVRPLLEGFDPAEGTMGELEIVIALKAVPNPGVLFLDHPNFSHYLANIEAMGVKEKELYDAIETIRMDRSITMTPSAILHELRRARAPKQTPFARGNVSKISRSRVAL